MRLAGRRTGLVLLFAVLPAALLLLFAIAAPRSTYAWDFHAFWGAAADVAHRRDPFAAQGFNADGLRYDLYLYPPLLADLLLPLGLLPFFPAAVIFTAGSVVAILAALRLLGVRDLRCYGVPFLWVPVLHGLRLGALTPLLVLGVAVCWRLRHGRKASVPLAIVAVIKLFLWPLVVWQATQSGVRVAARTIAVALALVVGSWATIGFAHLTGYPHLLRGMQARWMGHGYGLAALGHAVGLADGATTQLLFSGAATAVAAIAIGTRRGLFDERESLVLFLCTACLFSPVGWLHYSALWLVAVALLSPTLSVAWLVPLAFWITPFEESGGTPWRILVGLAVGCATIASAMRNHRRVGDRVNQRTEPPRERWINRGRVDDDPNNDAPLERTLRHRSRLRQRHA